MKKNHTYAIIDIETTGGRADRDRITEIGIVISDGKTVLDSFESLVNPETSIPFEITRLTGIDNQMVEDAPKFYEIAKKIVEITENTIFVAHNVRFDYGFIQEEFRRLGFAFTRKKICTVVLSRKAFPGLKSYSLGNLITYFNIEAIRRHRALDDAKATTILLEYILASQAAVREIDRLVGEMNDASILPPEISAEKIEALPEACGVYYFYSKSGELAYIGKALNIKNRVWEHFRGINKKGENMQRYVADISYQETGSELVALLLETAEIKKFKPFLNKASKNSHSQAALYVRTNPTTGQYFSLATSIDQNEPGFLNSFPSVRAAKKLLNNIIREFALCPDYSVGHFRDQACFDYMLGYCKGICCGKEDFAEYELRFQAAIDKLKMKMDGSWILIDKASNYESKSYVLIEEGIYIGFGSFSNEQQIQLEEMKESISKVNFHVDYQRIVKRFFNKKYITKIKL